MSVQASMTGSQHEWLLSQGFECLFLCNAATTLARSALTDPALSLDYVLQLAVIVRLIDKVVPLIAEVDSSFQVEAVKAALSRSHHAEISAIVLDDTSYPNALKKIKPRMLLMTRAFSIVKRQLLANAVELGLTPSSLLKRTCCYRVVATKAFTMPFRDSNGLLTREQMLSSCLV